MSEPDAFENILAALHEAALDSAAWTGAAALIDEALGVHGSTLACGDGESEEDFRLYFMWTCLHGRRRRDLERLWLETYFPLDKTISRMRRMPYNRATHITEVYTGKELKTSAVCDWLRSHDAGNAINVRLEGPGGSRIHWQIHDPVDRDGWTCGRLQRVGRLQPHVRQTVRVRQALDGAGALGATLTQLLDAAGVGVVHLDARGRILAANDRARSLLKTGDALCDKGGFLFAKHPSVDDSLRALVARALPSLGNQGEAGSLMLKRSAPLPPIMLHVNPLRQRDAWFRGWPVAAHVVLTDRASGTHVDPDLTAAVLGFTPTETEIAVLLARGLTVRQIAASTGRTYGTVRSHLKNMYAKLGVSRQFELAQAVLSLWGLPSSPE
ncbi:MAG: helix-turn-helix transcriptional regulator [Gammaproteobacteria bacterium]|nr:helix-turn-helix transcriptional regulator [Gammaproteobacteria bacterium]